MPFSPTVCRFHCASSTAPLPALPVIFTLTLNHICAFTLRLTLTLTLNLNLVLNLNLNLNLLLTLNNTLDNTLSNNTHTRCGNPTPETTTPYTLSRSPAP